MTWWRHFKRWLNGEPKRPVDDYPIQRSRWQSENLDKLMREVRALQQDRKAPGHE